MEEKLTQYPDNTKMEQRGTLLSYETGKELPFSINRLVLIRNMPIGAIRGNHANMNGECAIFLIAGQVIIILDDGAQEKREVLSTPGEFVYIPAKIWIKVESRQPDSSVCICASNTYEEAIYLSDYEQYII